VGRLAASEGRHVEVLKPIRVVPIDMLFAQFGEDLRSPKETPGGNARNRVICSS
jgi:hypothetical protein